MTTESASISDRIKLILTINEEPVGIQGLSAYEVALKNGFVGTEAEWLYYLAEQSNDYAAASALAAQQAQIAAETAQANAVDAQAAAELAEAAAITAKTDAVVAQNAAESAESGAQSSEANSMTYKNAALAAQQSSESAASSSGNARDGAVLAQTASEQARDAAINAKNAAVVAQNAAEIANTNAQDAKTAAQAAKTAAESASATATTAKNDAVTAKLAAETANTSAQAASTNAQTAKTAAETANTAAQSAKTAAQSAQSAAESANTAAQSAKTSAETANTNAQSANTAAQAAKTSAETANTAAQAAKTAAETAATNAGTSATSAQAAAASFPTLYPVNSYKSRVEADSGVIQNYTLLKWLNDQLQKQINDSAFFWSGVGGVKTRTSGNNTFAAKIYSFPGATNDASQATTGSQPYVGGGIAPNERIKLKSMKAAEKGMTFITAISKTNTQAWTISWAARRDNMGATIDTIFGHSSGNSWIGLGTSGNFSFKNAGGTVNSISGAFNNNEFGKVNIYTATFDGGGATGYLVLYKNGSLVGDLACDGAFAFDTIMNHGAATGRSWAGAMYFAGIWGATLPAADVMLQHAALRQISPDIEGVNIGNQHWATSNYEGVVDSAGNIIPEVQTSSYSSNTELAINGNFESGLAGTMLADGGESATWSLNTVSPISGTQDGRLVVSSTGTSSGTPRLDFAKSGSSNSGIYIVTLSYKVNSGTCKYSIYDTFPVSAYLGGIQISGSGSISLITKSTSIYIAFDGRNTFDVQIDNVSIKEAGWTDAQTVYDWYYSCITGTSAVKDLAATKAAAMWCNINNSNDTGALYGKLYNWYATKLISLYPPRGWRVPSTADFTQLQTFLGGATVAGGKCKLAGTTFWGGSNVGATNESGFTMLGNGYRYNGDGSFIGFGTIGYLRSSDSGRFMLITGDATSLIASLLSYPIQGAGIRLMRNEPVGSHQRMETTGLFTTDIASTAKQLPIPFGYVAFALRITSEQALTAVEVKLYDTAGNAIATLITGKTVAAGSTQVLRIAVDHAANLQDATLRMTASGNSGSTIGIEMQAILFKSTIN